MIKYLKLLLSASLVLALVACAGGDKSNAEAADSEAASAAEDGPLALGSSAPMAEVEMLAVDGSRISIADAAGEKGTLVIFTCNHCPYVKAWQERLVALANEYSEQGVGVIAINPNDPSAYPTDDMEGMVARAEAQGMQYPYVVDATSDIARAFGASRTPELFLFDAGGELVYYGAVDDNAQDPEAVQQHYLRDALAALVAGDSIETASSKAIGCSIKFRDADKAES